MAFQTIRNREDLMVLDELRDKRTCGQSLSVHRTTCFSDAGAHDPTATFYFVLEDLFAKMGFDGQSHLLDVGCGAGRVLAFFASTGIPGRATGVELDPKLVRACESWIERFSNINVVNDSALNLDLGIFSHLYLFNPFDNYILQQFVIQLEAQATQPVTMCHMSDNGENYMFMGRWGWTLLHEGEFHKYDGVPVYGCPQHYSIWRFDPDTLMP